jgi:hypothetical protein
MATTGAALTGTTSSSEEDSESDSSSSSSELELESVKSRRTSFSYRFVQESRVGLYIPELELDSATTSILTEEALPDQSCSGIGATASVTHTTGWAVAFHLFRSNSEVLVSSFPNEASLTRALLADLRPCLTR